VASGKVNDGFGSAWSRLVAGTVLRVVVLVWYTPNMTRSGMLIGKFK